MVGVVEHAQPAFRWRTRVYWEDTDAGGVVYHAGYLRFLERARTEWMRAHGMGQQALRESQGVVFVVREIDIAFDKPARLDDELDATLRVTRLRSASIEFAQEVLRAADGVTLARARVRIACVDAREFVPVRIPPDISALIEGNTHA
ncbi:MAG: tol-pal system-associated acyl-CoA thioesterase [Xanthomonadales bacterium]|nr:tol-pal system-associated acyl-CoA thioesterase [Xanthomonadales bacterium]ODU94464.1 MAG: tol-pal system-associated acyl-CoA thioesterase [Rhodanobacter sp. SCN 66-43]OJY87072.1 MAG: tol-pal system-associated acyl-CoA thioesterase [Xanthomonadales bacterium 66-474]